MDTLGNISFLAKGYIRDRDFFRYKLATKYFSDEWKDNRSIVATMHDLDLCPNTTASFCYLPKTADVTEVLPFGRQGNSDIPEVVALFDYERTFPIDGFIMDTNTVKLVLSYSDKTRDDRPVSEDIYAARDRALQRADDLMINTIKNGLLRRKISWVDAKGREYMGKATDMMVRFHRGEWILLITVNNEDNGMVIRDIIPMSLIRVVG